MWQTKTFKTREEMESWIAKHTGKIQYEEVFINNGYGIEWRWVKYANGKAGG